MSSTDTVSEETWGRLAAVMIARLMEKGILRDVIECMTPEERADFNRGVAQIIG